MSKPELPFGTMISYKNEIAVVIEDGSRPRVITKNELLKETWDWELGGIECVIITPSVSIGEKTRYLDEMVKTLLLSPIRNQLGTPDLYAYANNLWKQRQKFIEQFK